ncbi:MAG: Fe-S cluster assembly protein SufD [Gemmatimonadales bacterium]
MTIESYVQDFERHAANGGGQAAWLMPIRRNAIDRFREAGFPDRKDEDWKFTNVAKLARTVLPRLAAPAEPPAVADLEDFLIGHRKWPRIVFVNGHYVEALSTLDELPSGVTVQTIAEAMADRPEFLMEHLTKAAPIDGNSFTALNTAFMADGLVVHVARETVVEHPIHVLYATDPSVGEGVSYPRTLVVLEPQARAAMVESYVGLSDGMYFTNAVSEVSLAVGARLDHYKIQRESEQAFHIGTLEARQERDSHFESLSFAFGGAVSRTNIYTVLDGEGSNATLNGLYVVHGDQHVDHQTRIEHTQPNCTSREVYKGILDDRSHGVFNGKVYVHPIAQKTDGKQTNQNLLISPTAKVDTKPQLEIFADDVRCTHGATVGQLDEQAMFYCRSRGLSPAEAKTLLTYGFAADVLEQISSREVATYLERLVMQRFLGTRSG